MTKIGKLLDLSAESPLRDLIIRKGPKGDNLVIQAGRHGDTTAVKIESGQEISKALAVFVLMLAASVPAVGTVIVGYMFRLNGYVALLSFPVVTLATCAIIERFRRSGRQGR